MNNSKVIIILVMLTFFSSCSFNTNPAQKIAEFFGGDTSSSVVTSDIDDNSDNDESLNSNATSTESNFFTKFLNFDNDPLTKNMLSVNLLESINIGDAREINSTVIQLAYDNKNTLYSIDNSGTISAIDIRSLDKLWSKNIDISVTSGLCYHNEKLFFGSNIGKLYGYSINDLKQGSGLIDSLNIFDDNSIDTPTVTNIQLKSEIASPGIGIGNSVFVKLGDGDVAAVNYQDQRIKWTHKGRNVSLSIKGTAKIASDFDNVYIARDDGNLISLNSDSGKLNWLSLISPRSGRNDLESLRDVEMTPIIDQGVLFVGFYQGNLAAVDIITGGIIWKTPLSVHSNINLDTTSVYVSSSKGTLYSIDRYDGSIIWNIVLNEDLLYTEPHIIENKIITFSTEGDIAVIDRKTGNLLHYENIIDELDFQTDIYLIDKVLYILSKNGRLNAININ